MKKIICLFFLISILTACGQSEEGKESAGEKWSEIQQSGKIVVATAGTLYPASYYPEGSDRLTGYDVEVIRELANRLGLEVEFEIMAFDAMLAALQSGRVDLITAGPREESKDKFIFSEPIKYSYSTMIVRSEDLSGINTLEDLKGKKAGGAATTVYSDIARKYGAEVITYGNATNDVYLRDVDNGRTDVVINDYYLQSLALEAFPEMDITLHPELKFHPQTVNVVTQKEATVFSEKIDGVLEGMREDGALTNISKQFFGGQDVSKKLDSDIKEIEGVE
ncbi:transporter substrate-binding domain-containing protein [Paraliobacillus salinarum]|uniref:transporter substrate-binding domain-containing protein n=1 Tax=Paraliobacillus salinarum TaxID=1158996 RepID=UPI0015F53BA1|nr:transporter substrate-binding domain-containing protein [Paraliobacillus salinarum]